MVHSVWKEGAQFEIFGWRLTPVMGKSWLCSKPKQCVWEVQSSVLWAQVTRMVAQIQVFQN